MTSLQRVVMALAMLSVVFMLLWVPYKASYKWRNSSWTNASAGYDWIFEPPNSKVCVNSIATHLDSRASRFDLDECHVSLDTRQLVITLAAVTIGSLAIMLLLSIIRPRQKHAMRATSQTLAELAASPPTVAPPAADHHQKKKEQDRARLGVIREALRINPSLPIGSGDMTQAHPLVITAKNDYVSVEYEVIDVLHSQIPDLEAALQTQGLIRNDGQHIDALTFRYTKANDATWSRVATYYFDISAGMNELLRSLNKQWWQIWK